MIAIFKDYDNPPSVLVNQSRAETLLSAYNAKSGDLWKTYHYSPKSKTNFPVKDALIELYNGKCAYCEQKVEDLEVEHYRPKAIYYWLGCEWSNLLLSCSTCNSKEHKGSHFPIEGKLADAINPVYQQVKGKKITYKIDRKNLLADSESLILEKPQLLNPEIDIPEEHLYFSRLGELKFKTNRGEKTIKILGLNRFNLFKKRQILINKWVLTTKMILKLSFSKRINEDKFVSFCDMMNEFIFEEMKAKTSKKEEFSLWGRYIWVHFEECFLARFLPDYQPFIKEAFHLFLNKST